MTRRPFSKRFCWTVLSTVNRLQPVFELSVAGTNIDSAKPF
jgi:hypothetical protein